MKIHDKIIVCLTAALLSAPAFPAWASDKSAPESDPAASDAVKNADSAADKAAQKQHKEDVREGFAGSYLSGLFARSSGDVKEAIRYLEDAHERNPDDANVTSQLQGMLLLDGQIPEAVELAQDLNEDGAQDTVSLLLVALKDIKNNDYPAAAKIMDEATGTGSAQLWQPLLSAWVDVGQHKLNKALTLDDLSASVGRAAALANYHLALINNAAGYKDAAAQNFKDAIEDPQSPPLHIMEALLSFYTQNNNPKILTPVIDAYRAANPDSTLKSDIALPTSPQEGAAEVLFTMGSVMIEAEVAQDATIYLRLALYMEPDFSAAAITLGDAYSDLNQFPRSNEIYDSIVPSDRFYAMAQMRIAMNYDRMNDTKMAIAQLDKMIKKTPDNYEAWMAKGDLMRVHSHYPEAIEDYTQAIKRMPEMKSYEWPLFFARGACYERLGKWNLSEKDMQQALQLKPDQPDVLNYLGYSWLTRGEHLDEAHAMLEKAVKARPNDAQIVDSMGWSLYLLGDYAKAETYVEKAVELLPADPTVNDHLGDVYWREGRKTEARYQWQQSLAFNPDADEAGALHKKLKDGLPPAPANAAQRQGSQAASPVVASRQPAESGTPTP